MSGGTHIVLPEGGTVRSVGTDIIECARIQKVFERQGDRFLKRVYTESEQAYCLGMKNPIPHLAARFAAKEAVSKCFTTGIGQWLGWKSVEVRKGSRGEPIVHLDTEASKLLQALGGSEVLLTLSHTENYGVATAILVGRVVP
jgi:holo-[acyl-carrier protein] synthase